MCFKTTLLLKYKNYVCAVTVPLGFAASMIAFKASSSAPHDGEGFTSNHFFNTSLQQSCDLLGLNLLFAEMTSS